MTSDVQAETDFNAALMKQNRLVAWDCSTMTLKVIRDGLIRDRDAESRPLRHELWVERGTLTRFTPAESIFPPVLRLFQEVV